MKKYQILILLFFLFSCKDKYGSWDVKQLSLKFTILDSNKLFKLYPKDSIDFNYYAKNLVYYDSSGVKKEMKYVIIGTNEQNINPKYFISVGEIAEMSSDNIKNYFIYWPNGERDTLFADYKRDNGLESKNSCGCSHPLAELKLNGKSFVRKTDYDRNGIYIFDR